MQRAKNIFYGLLPSASLGTANIVKGFETPKHFITFPPLFITFSPFSAKSAKVGAVLPLCPYAPPFGGGVTCCRSVVVRFGVVEVLAVPAPIGYGRVASYGQTGGNIRSVIFGFPRLWVCRWLQPQPPTIRTASILASGGTLAPLAVWLFICSVSALCGGSLAVSLSFFVVRSLFNRQKADKGRQLPTYATFPHSVGCRSASVASVPCRLSIGFAPLPPSAPRGCRLPCGAWQMVGAWQASSRWVVASRLSPYSLALSSRVSAWVVNLPLNRLIASCFFASTIFA